MKRPALLLALLAVLTAAPPVYSDYKADLQTLPATLDPTGCPNGDQSAQKEWAQRNEAEKRNESGCAAGETISQCLRRQHSN